MEIFYVLLVLLIVTRAFGELAIRLGQVAIVGELVAGIALGVVVHEFGAAFPVLAGLTEDEVFRAVTDLAVFFLMLLAGIEMHPREMARASRSAGLVAVGGMLVPLAMGCALGWAFLPPSPYRIAQTLFVGTALAVTAVPVSVRVLMDLNLLDSRVGNTIVSAAIFDDALSLLLLAVLLALIRTGDFPSTVELLQLGGQILAFFAITVGLGLFVLPRFGRWTRRLVSVEAEFNAIVVVALGYSVLAELLGLHFILGAFLAGLYFSGRAVTPKIYEDVKTKISGLTTGFLGPLFFASIGLHLDPRSLTSIPVFLVLFIVAAFAGKLLGAGVAARLTGLSGRESLVVGMGMSARATVELVIAGIALRHGLFEHPQPVPPIVHGLFSVVVMMAVVSSTTTPIVLKMLLASQRQPDEQRA